MASNPLSDREEVLGLFVEMTNICQPEHPYYDDPYPISRTDVKEGYHRVDSGIIASCGPQSGRYVVSFSPCTKHLTRKDFEQVLAFYTHEIAHITEGRHTGGAAHDKSFWREMAFMAWKVRENKDEIESYVERAFDMDSYIESVVFEPNASNIDRRIETVSERRQEMAELLGVANEYDF